MRQSFSSHVARYLLVVLTIGWCGVSRPDFLAAAEPDGKKIYEAKCAVCHGPQGEGTKKHKRALAGEKSLAQLAELIGDTMPEDKPGSLTAEEAKAVAAFIHDAFYSAVARERNRPARVELARLTVRQYRQAIADVIGGFREPPRWGTERGLRGEYFSGRRLGGGRRNREGGGGRTVRRVDSQVKFDFGTEKPAPEIEEDHEFSIRWSGSLLAPETGEYEFLVRTEHACRLWVNETERALIDAWVKSGNETEYRGTLFLTGGRVYPLRLEFTKAKQGVDDSKKQKEKPKSAQASIALLWKQPGRGAEEVIPSRQLSPEGAREQFICTTAFPPDDRSYGWERGTFVSKAWDEATTAGAIEAAAYVVSRLNDLAGTRDDAGERLDKLRRFCRSFAERAFRRPLTDDQTEMLIGKQFGEAKDLESAVKRVVVLVLKSPRFLFREVGGEGDAYDTASRLSFALWDSIPDDELRKAAAEKRLDTKDQISQQAERMLADPRGKLKLREFLLTWLKADRNPDLSKDPEKFPGFDSAVIADLRTSLELFLNDVMWSEEADFRRLLLAEEVIFNDRLAKFYGVEAASNGEFSKVKLEEKKRAGVLTHPYLMASFAYTRETSPIHRGVFLVRGILGQALRPPPEAVAPLPPDLHPDLTTRERVTVQTKAANCMTCHGVINPLGFTLEHFDAVGRYRDEDRGKPIDASGGYRTENGKAIAVNGSRELAEFLAGNEEVHEAFVEQMFHALVQQPVRAYGETTLADLRKGFAEGGFHVRKLAVAIVAVGAQSGKQE